jgi:hypothetical protein
MTENPSVEVQDEDFIEQWECLPQGNLVRSIDAVIIGACAFAAIHCVAWNLAEGSFMLAVLLATRVSMRRALAGWTARKRLV